MSDIDEQMAPHLPNILLLEENPAFARDLNLFLVKDEKAQRGTPFKFTILVFPSPRKWFLPLPVQNIFMKKPT